MVNFNTDGNFQIKTGQGITQGIASELGLDENQCRQINNSIWNQIITEIDKEGSLVTTRNGKVVENPQSSNKFLVHPEDIIQVSKACWNKIVGWVNDALKLNINKLEENQESQNNEKVAQNETEKQEICKKAYMAILENFDNLELPQNFDKTNIKTKLEQVYQNHLKDLVCNY